MARSSPALSEAEAEVKNGATTRGREGEKRKQGRKEGKREDGMKKRGREFCATRGRGKGERIGREGRQKFLVVPEKRPGIMCTHRCNFISLSLSREEKSRAEVPRLEKTWRGRKFGIFVPAFFTFLSCCARVVPAIPMPDDEPLGRRNGETLGLHACRGNNGAALFTVNRGTFPGELKERGGVVGINRECLR